MNINEIVGGIAAGVIRLLIITLVIFLIFAGCLTAWGIYEVTTNPAARVDVQQVQELQRNINENQSRIINAVPAGG